MQTIFHLVQFVVIEKIGPVTVDERTSGSAAEIHKCLREIQIRQNTNRASPSDQLNEKS